MSVENGNSDILKKAISSINEVLAKNGLLVIDLVNPNSIKPQKKNARYMSKEVADLLKSNIKDSGMESVPLVHKMEDGSYECISGHHRIDGAKANGMNLIMVLVLAGLKRDEIVSKQLSHNSLVGTDDKILLKDLFGSITDVSLKLTTGLQSEIEKISYETINFRVGNFEEMTFLFLPEDIDLYETMIDKIINECNIKSTSKVRIQSLDSYEKITKAIRKVKKVENIKSNGTALTFITELVNKYYEDNEVRKV